MKRYSIVAEARNKHLIIIDEVRANSTEEAISVVKKKHNLSEVTSCIVSLVKGE